MSLSGMALPSIPATGSASLKLDQEYEAMASGIEPPTFYDGNGGFFTVDGGAAHRHDVSGGHAVGMELTPMSPMGSPDHPSNSHPHHGHTALMIQSQWNLTSRGKEYLAQKQAAAHPACTCPPSEHVDMSCKGFIGVEPMATKQQQQHRKHHHHQIKTYKCTFPECGKTFITRKEQQNHIARHSTEPRFYCEYPGCTCKYTTKSSLDLHVTRIHGEKKYKCDLCDERYSVRGDLNQHMKRKHNKMRKL